MCGLPGINVHFTENSCHHVSIHCLARSRPGLPRGTGKGGGRVLGASILVLGVLIRLGLLAELPKG